MTQKNHLILRFLTQVEAEACLLAIEMAAIQWWQSQGYTIIDDASSRTGKAIVTKKKGVDEPDLTRTTAYANIKQRGIYYWFSSPSNDIRFQNWKENLAAQGFTAIGEEIQYPLDWYDDA